MAVISPSVSPNGKIWKSGRTEEVKLKELAPSSWHRTCVQTEKLFAVSVEPKWVSHILTRTNHFFPLSQRWSHIRRAKKQSDQSENVQIIISEEPTLSSAAADDFLRQIYPQYALAEITVPVDPPRSPDEAKSQTEEFWPIVFRRNRLPWVPTPLQNNESDLINDNGKMMMARHEFYQGDNFDKLSPLRICSLRCFLLKDNKIICDENYPYWNNQLSPLDHSVMKAVETLGHKISTKRAKKLSDPRELNLEEVLLKDQYNALGFDVYLIGEPCVMCSMALVHSRVKRVFILWNGGHETAEGSEVRSYLAGRLYRNSWTGGLGGLGEDNAVSWKRGLNHHFPVYSVSCE